MNSINRIERSIYLIVFLIKWQPMEKEKTFSLMSEKESVMQKQLKGKPKE